MNRNEVLKAALERHQAGMLAEAEAGYRLLLKENGNDAEAVRLLGVLAGQIGRPDLAVQLLSRAIALCPERSEAHGNLGCIWLSLGNYSEAIACQRRAIALNPGFLDARYNLGCALERAGDLEEAIRAYRGVLETDPGHFQALNNLGNCYIAKGDRVDGILAYRGAIQLNPACAETFINLGHALLVDGEVEESLSVCREAVRLRPNSAEARMNLGNALLVRGEPALAEERNNEAARIMPDGAEAPNNGERALQETALEAAIREFREAVRLDPNNYGALSNLGGALQTNGSADEAITCFEKATRLRPCSAGAYNNLGSTFLRQGQVVEAIASYEKALACEAEASVAGNRLYALHFLSSYDARGLLEEHRKWNEQYAKGRPWLPSARLLGRKEVLRVGFVSPDFSSHVVGRSLLALFREHDRTKFEFICYSNGLHRDDYTEELKSHVSAWRNIAGLGDERAAEMIWKDEIDILVDLSLHTARNRLLIFAYKPAPAQVSYLGYCSTTGLEAMDYRLSDPYIDPLGTDLGCYSEETIRLERSYWGYEPLEGTPLVKPLSTHESPNITFGCLNKFTKSTAEAQNLWAEILGRVADSRLVLHAPPGSIREEVHGRFEALGISRDRVMLIGSQGWEGYVKTLEEIHIALDPFPYGGGITTCDALWMGVPVVTLSGRTAVGRGGCSILSNVGLPELIAKTPEEYVEIAIKLANDWKRLCELRVTLRDQMERSPLRDTKGFARDVEQAFERIWKKTLDRDQPAATPR